MYNNFILKNFQISLSKIRKKSQLYQDYYGYIKFVLYKRVKLVEPIRKMKFAIFISHLTGL